MKKLLIISLVCASTIFAGDYVSVGYEKASLDDGQKYDFNSYVLEYSKIDKDYLFSAYIYYEPTETSTGTYDGIKYKYEDEALNFAATCAYKVLKMEGLFLAPYLSYSKSNSKTKEINTVDKSVDTSENKKNYLSLRVMVGYDYGDDSYVYAKTKIKELIQDENRNTIPLTVGIKHKFGENILVGGYYGKSLDNPSGINNSWYGFDVGYGF